MPLPSTKSNRTLRLNEKLLTDAKKNLGYKTYTETIEQTLKIALNNLKHQKLLKKMRGKSPHFKSLYA